RSSRRACSSSATSRMPTSSEPSAPSAPGFCFPTRAPRSRSWSARAASRSSCCRRSTSTPCTRRTRRRARPTDRYAGGVSARALREAPVAVLGAGSWGTALAIQFAHGGPAGAVGGRAPPIQFPPGGRPVRLWGRDAALLAEMAANRRNQRYLPSAALPESLRVEPDLTSSLSGARDVLIVVPSHAFRALLTQLVPQLAPEPHVVWATKGFEQGSLMLPHQIAREVLGAERRVAVLSGPTFAREVGAGLPT